MVWFAILGSMAPALAGRPQVLTVVVHDGAGEPIPNAWVRVPGTERRRAVEPDTGVWEAAFVYQPDGTPLIFEKGMDVELTITAPGYRPRRIVYRLRGRKNVVDIGLEPVADQSPLRQGAETIDELMEQWLKPPPVPVEEED